MTITVASTQAAVTDEELSALLTAAGAARTELERLSAAIRAAESVRHATFHAALVVETALRGQLDSGYSAELAARYALVQDAADDLVEALDVMHSFRPESCAGCRPINL